MKACGFVCCTILKLLLLSLIWGHPCYLHVCAFMLLGGYWGLGSLPNELNCISILAIIYN